MKKIIYFCALMYLGLNTIAQRKINPSFYDTYCSYMIKNLSFTYNNIQNPITLGWIYISDYSDEFNDNSLNTNKWLCWDHRYHINNTNVGYLSENVNVSDGHLVLSAKYDENAQTYINGQNQLSLNFNTGCIESLYKIQYGYYEVECYLPKNHKYRPCFWTVGGTTTDYDEIDVFEIHPNDNSPYIFLQNEYSNISRPNTSLIKQTILCSDSITGKTTVFGVEVLPYELVFYVNGHVSSRLIYNYDYANNYNIFTCTDITKTIPMKFILSFTFDPVNGNMPQPHEDFIVNYIRCYKLDRGTIDTYNPINFVPTAASSKVYPHVILGGVGHTATINTPSAIWAEQSIILDKGFELSSGVSFSARIIQHGNDNPEDSPLYIGNFNN